MGVGVDQARHDQPAAGIHPLPPAIGPLYLLAGPHSNDGSPIHSHRPWVIDVPILVSGQHDATDYYQINFV
jgi:hypothetical protein